MEYRVLGRSRWCAATEPRPNLEGCANAHSACPLLARGQVVSVERLIDDLWGGAPPRVRQRHPSVLRVHAAPHHRARSGGRCPSVGAAHRPSRGTSWRSPTPRSTPTCSKTIFGAARDADTCRRVRAGRAAIATGSSVARAKRGANCDEPWAPPAEAARLTELREPRSKTASTCAWPATGLHHSIVAELESLVALGRRCASVAGASSWWRCTDRAVSPTR